MGYALNPHQRVLDAIREVEAEVSPIMPPPLPAPEEKVRVFRLIALGDPLPIFCAEHLKDRAVLAMIAAGCTDIVTQAFDMTHRQISRIPQTLFFRPGDPGDSTPTEKGA